MRRLLIYLSWLGTWFCSHMYYAYEGTATAPMWLESSRFMIFFSIYAFAFIAADKREKSIALQVELEHILFIIGVKVIGHFFEVLKHFGLPVIIRPYHYDVINYVFAALYIVITPVRIVIVKRNKRYG